MKCYMTIAKSTNVFSDAFMNSVIC